MVLLWHFAAGREKKNSSSVKEGDMPKALNAPWKSLQQTRAWETRFSGGKSRGSRTKGGGGGHLAQHYLNIRQYSRENGEQLGRQEREKCNDQQGTLEKRELRPLDSETSFKKKKGKICTTRK